MVGLNILIKEIFVIKSTMFVYVYIVIDICRRLVL